MTTITSPRVRPDAWLEVFEHEYLADFVPQGGSTVKFLSGGASNLAALQTRLRQAAESRRFRYVELNAGELNAQEKKPDFHRPENFFFAITRRMDWLELAQSHIVSALGHRGIVIPSGVKLNDYEAIAKQNGRDPQDLLGEYKRILTDQVIRDRRMARDFRTAIAALSRQQLIPDELTPTTAEILLGWLHGMSLPGSASALKRVSIREKINRSNARFMIISLCHWLRAAAEPGLVVVLDFRAYERVKHSKAQYLMIKNRRLLEAIESGADRNELTRIAGESAADIGVTYSRGAYLNALELLRHLIDGIEEMPGLAVVVLASPRFFDDRKSESTERRFTDYNALQTRIGLEVHDVERQNLSASLVHLEAE